MEGKKKGEGQKGGVGRTRDTPFVAKLAQLDLAPRVDQLIRAGQGVLGVVGAAVGLGAHAQVGQAGVAADRGDEGVALSSVVLEETKMRATKGDVR